MECVCVTFYLQCIAYIYTHTYMYTYSMPSHVISIKNMHSMYNIIVWNVSVWCLTTYNAYIYDYINNKTIMGIYETHKTNK